MFCLVRSGVLGLACGMALSSASAAPLPFQSALAEGDILLQRSQSSQSEALRLATGSPWTHVGMVFRRGDQWQVLEAVQPVRWTPLERWAARGRDGEVLVLRYDAPFDVADLRATGESYLGRPYDGLFQWSDERIYCSELVYKAWIHQGIPLGEQQRMGSFDLSSPPVQALIAARTTGGVDPEEVVVAPGSFVSDPHLRRVWGRP